MCSFLCFSWFLVKLLIGQLAPWATWMGYLTLAHKTQESKGWVLGAGCWVACIESCECLVRAAWERRPEGPAYLLSICDAPISRRPVCFLLHTLTPLDQWNSERVFPEFLRFRTRLL